MYLYFFARRASCAISREIKIAAIFHAQSRTPDAVFSPLLAGEPGCRRQALVSRVKCEGALVDSAARWPLRGRENRCEEVLR